MKIMSKTNRMWLLLSLLLLVLILNGCGGLQADNILPGNENVEQSRSETLEVSMADAGNETAYLPEQEITIWRGEVSLYGLLQIPELEQGEKIPLVILCHGFMSGHNEPVLSEIAEQLIQEKTAVLRFDFNGHGKSSGEMADMTVSNEIEDTIAVLEYAKKLEYVSEIVIAGHSQGGVVAGMAAGKRPEDVSALVLLAPAAVLKENALNGTVLGVEFDPEQLPDSIGVFGQEIGRGYLEDAQTLPIWEESKKFTGPVCIINGQEDEIVPVSVGERYHELYPGSELHVLDGTGHTFSGSTEDVAAIVTEFVKSIGKTER